MPLNQRLVVSSLLLSIFLLSLFLRTHIYNNTVRGTGGLPFFNVCAFHYYFAEKVRQGDVIPHLDKKIQYPEGIDTGTLSIFSEYVVGYLGRVFSWLAPRFAAKQSRQGARDCEEPDFENLVRWFVRVMGAISVLLAYLLAREVLSSNMGAGSLHNLRSANERGKLKTAHWQSRVERGALFAAALYGTSLASISRTTGLGFLRENFALPLLFANLLFLLRFLRNSRRREIIASGVFLLLSFASWHLTQFWWILLIFYFAAMLFLRCKELRQIRIGFIYLIIASLAASLLVPYLRRMRFFISLPMLFSYAVLGGLILKERLGKVWQKAVVVLGIFSLLFLITRPGLFAVPSPLTGLPNGTATGTASGCVSTVLRGKSRGRPFAVPSKARGFARDLGVYSHVYSMGIYKLRYLGVKPEDPERLPFEARLLWDISHTSPRPRDAVRYIGILFILGLPLAFKRFRGRGNAQDRLLLWLSVSFLVLYLFINRLGVFLIFFICIWAGGLPLSVSVARLKRLATLILSVVLGVQIIAALGLRIYIPPFAYYERDTLRWIKMNTPLDSVILAPPRSSPEVAAYTGRAVCLHAKLETPQLRQKTRVWAEALFKESEEPLYQLCKEWEVDYLLFPLGTYSNTGLRSWRYITDNLDKDTRGVGYRLEGSVPGEEFSFRVGDRAFRGRITKEIIKEGLNHFQRVYYNRYFNIYEVKP